jgi:hypothetical protein
VARQLSQSPGAVRKRQQRKQQAQDRWHCHAWLTGRAITIAINAGVISEADALDKTKLGRLCSFLFDRWADQLSHGDTSGTENAGWWRKLETRR